MNRKRFQRPRTSEAEKIRARVMRRRRQADYNARRRASTFTDVLEDVSRDEIRERDGETCHVCGGWVSVHEMSLDHVRPLARGGAHTRDNIKLAHKVCNSRKGAR